MNHRPSAASSPAEQAIAAHIAQAMPTLTPIHRRMGEYVLANLFRAATMRIDELASVVGASVATANRFARALGFDGYPQFREALVRGFEATLAPVERLRSAQESLAPGDDLIDASLEQAASNLNATRTAIDRAAADAAVDAIIAARRVFVLGYGASAFLAGLMEHGLTPYHDNVQSLALMGGPTHAARRLFASNEDDLVIGIAFPALCRRHDRTRTPRSRPRRTRASAHRRPAFAARAVREPLAVHPRGPAARGERGFRRARRDRSAVRRGRVSRDTFGESGRRSQRIRAAVAGRFASRRGWRAQQARARRDPSYSP